MTSCVLVLSLIVVLVGMEALVKGRTVRVDREDQARRLSEARLACYTLMENEPYPTSGLYCGRVWDGWLCWPETPAGTTSAQACPNYIAGFDTSRKATRVCTSAGEWWAPSQTNVPWSNYTSCVNIQAMMSLRLPGANR